MNNRLSSMLLIGFASGLPLALTSSTLQAWFTESGISLLGIGALSLIGQPYVFKFLWAPFLDKLMPPCLGKRRGWMLLMQCIIILCIVTIAFLKPSHQASLIGMIALVMAFASATQDIAADAYRADILPPQERGFGSSLFITGYRIAMLVAGGVALVIADRFGWHLTYLLMAFCMLLGVLVCFLAPSTTNEKQTSSSWSEVVVEPFKEILSRPGAILILTFIIIYKLGDAFTLSLSTTFLLRGLDFSLTIIGTINKSLSIIGSVGGALLGGWWMRKLGLFRALLIFGIAQALSNLAYMLLAIIGKNLSMMAFAVFLEHFCGGLATVAFLAFLMSLCDQRYSATQFALLSALSAVGRVFVGPIAAVMVNTIGWIQFYFLTFVIALPGLWLLIRLRQQMLADETIRECPI